MPGRRDMNWKRGLLRLWIVLALLWVIRGVWVWWPAVAGDCSPFGGRVGDQRLDMSCKIDEIPHDSFLDSAMWDYRVDAAVWILFPPLAFLILGMAGIWIVGGFRRKNSN